MSMSHALGIFIVCDHALPDRLQAAQRLAIPTAQILAPDQRDKNTAVMLAGQFRQAGLQITVVFCGFPGESYSDIPTVQKTVGLVPPATRPARLQQAKEISDFAAFLNVPVTALHVGFVPDDPDSADYQNLLQATRALCDHCRSHNQRLHLETGQESAASLIQFISRVDRDNLAVNFDPANMILYGCGEPLPALRQLGSLVKSVHCKDAKWALRPGVEWGQETALGQGDVDMRMFLQTLKEIGYQGPLTIEREISGEQQLLDIQQAVALLTELRREMWG